MVPGCGDMMAARSARYTPSSMSCVTSTTVVRSASQVPRISCCLRIRVSAFRDAKGHSTTGPQDSRLVLALNLSSPTS
jgi:hypothetical protein